MENKNNEAISPMDARNSAGARDRAFQDIEGEGRTYAPPFEKNKNQYQINRGSWRGFGNSDEELEFNSALVYRPYSEAFKKYRKGSK